MIEKKPVYDVDDLVQVWTPIAAAVIAVILTILFLFRRLGSKKRILILGLNDAGKTVLFSKLINKNLNFETYTSLKANEFDEYKNIYGQEISLVDYPGAQRLRKHLFINYFGKERRNIKGVVFVVDSATFNKKASDVAEFLYDVLREIKDGSSLLVACNKQDSQLAKSSQAIKTTLEREIGLINSSRSSALQSTAGNESRNILTTSGRNFQWSDLPKIKIDFLDCCINKEYRAENGEILSSDIVRKWIDGIKA